MSIRPASDRVGIYLAPIALAHAQAIQVLASDARIAATSNVPHPYPSDGAVTWIRYTMAQRDLGRELNFAVMSEEEPGRGPSVVGVCGVLNIAGTPRRGELGYWIGVPFWGRGYATAAARALVKIVFEEHAVAELYSSCLVRNRPSYRVLEKVGFRHVGYGMHPHTKWGPDDRFALFELARQEWLEAQGPRG
jgi:RimJ/RimL family protein N-acetyltransferase